MGSSVDETVELLKDPKVLPALNAKIDRDAAVDALVRKSGGDFSALGRAVHRLHTKKGVSE